VLSFHVKLANLIRRIALDFPELDPTWIMTNVVIPVVMLTILSIAIGDLIINPDHLPGTDTYFHVALIDEAQDRFRAGEPIGPVAEAIDGGRPYLYDTDNTYPQFSYVLSLIFGLVTRSAGATYGLMLFAGLAVAQLTFYFGFRSRFGIAGSLIGALAFVYSPYTLTSIDPQGRFPGLMAVTTMPAMMIGTLSIMDSPSRRKWFFTALAFGISAAFHAMVFYIAVVPLAVTSALYVITNKIAVSRSVLAVAAVFAGVLALWIFLPDSVADLTQRGGLVGIGSSSDGPGVRATTGATSKFLPFSIRWNSFDVAYRLTNENYAGVGILIASIVALVVARNRQVFVFGGGTAVAYLLATGSLTPLWDHLPLASQLEPRRFLFPAYLSASVVIAVGSGLLVTTLANQQSRINFAVSGITLVLIIGAVAYDAVPMVQRIAPKPPLSENYWSESLARVDTDGRLFWNAHRDFSPYYFVGRQSGIETVGRVGSVDAAVREGFVDTAMAELALYRIRSLISDDKSFRSLVAAAEREGFKKIGQWSNQVLLASEKPSSIIMDQSRDVALVGTAANLYWSRIFSNSVVIHDPDQIPKELLSSFKIIVMSAYRTTNNEVLEKALTEYMDEGGIVIFEEPNKSGENLFGAEHTIKDVPEVFAVNGIDGPVEVLPFTISGGRFAGNYYEDIGEVTLTGSTPEGEIIPLVQKRDVGRGAMYWVCCNIGNHTVVNPGKDFSMASVISKYFESEIGEFRSIWPTSFDADVEHLGPSEYEISYTAKSPIPVIISTRAINKRSLVLEDGTRIQIYPFGPVGSALMPSGTHVVSLETVAAPVTLSIAFIWIIGLAFGVTILWRGWRYLSFEGPSTFMLALIGLRRYVTPKWSGEIPTARGTLLFRPPVLVPSYEELAITSGVLQVFTPIDGEYELAVLYVELKSPENKAQNISASDIWVHTDVGEALIPMDGVQIVEKLGRSSWISSLERRHSLLNGELDVEAEVPVSGFVVFAKPAKSEIVGVSLGFDPELYAPIK
jgi:hypothetical protein